MVEIIEALKSNEIIHSEGVKALKEYICKKYPNDSADRTAFIFADAVHKILDNNIVHFDEISRIAIKRNVITEASQKKVFSINAFEVFEVCTQLYVADEDYLKRLTTWINDNQSKIVSVDEVVELTIELRKPYEKEPEIPNHPELKETTRALKARLAALDAATKKQMEQAIIDEASIHLNDIVVEEPLQQVDQVVVEKPLQQVDQVVVEKPLKQTKHVIDENAFEQLQLKLLKQEHFLCKISSLQDIFLTKIKHHYKEALAAAVIIISLFALLSTLEYFNHGKRETTSISDSTTITNSLNMNKLSENSLSKTSSRNHLPKHLQYKVINLDALKNWLEEKNSALADEVYLNTITNTAKAYDINPLLMFAITGQEQAFVPKTSTDAEEMANNPFNVYGSWENYNTDIDDASKIAAQTILNLSSDCPKDEDPIKWINKKYAEDQNWHIGVSKIYNQLEKATTFD